MEYVVWGPKGGIRNNDCQLWASELSGMETQDFYPLSRRYLRAAWQKEDTGVVKALVAQNNLPLFLLSLL